MLSMRVAATSGGKSWISSPLRREKRAHGLVKKAALVHGLERERLHDLRREPIGHEMPERALRVLLQARSAHPRKVAKRARGQLFAQRVAAGVPAPESA